MLSIILTVRLILVFFCWLIPTSLVYAETRCAILLHGLGRSADSMDKIEQDLIDHDYKVWNKSYPSTEHSIAELAASAIQPGVDFCGGLAFSNFVITPLHPSKVRSALSPETELLTPGFHG